MDFLSVFTKMISLFLIILTGYVMCRCGVFGKDARTQVTKLVLNVAIPGLTLSAVLTQDTLPGAAEILQLLVVAFSSYLFLVAGAFLVPKLLRVEKSQVGIYRFMTAFANVGFIGYPVTQAIFGKEALFYTCVFNLPFNFIAYSLGVVFIQESAAQSGECDAAARTGESADTAQSGDSGAASQKRVISWRTFVTPCLISSALAIILAFTGWKAPAVIGDTLTMLGNITTPAALLIIGSSLAEMPVGEMFSNKKIYLLALFRLLILPLCIFGIYRLLLTDTLLLGECVVIAAMPVATNGTMLCLQYNADEKLMAQGTFITTLASLVTIPMLAMLFA